MSDPIVIDLPQEKDEGPAQPVEQPTMVDQLVTTWTYTLDVSKPLTRDEYIEMVREALKKVGAEFPRHILRELEKNDLLVLATFPEKLHLGQNGKGHQG
jgi:hypothetical protein